MPDDRRNSPRRGGNPSGKSSGSSRDGRSSRPGGSGDGRQSNRNGRSGGSGGKSGGGRGGRPPGGRGGSSGRGGSRDGDRRSYSERPEPRTEAERRAAEVRARRAPRVPKSEDQVREEIEAREIEEWVDEGSIRSEAEAATRRASRPSRGRGNEEIDPEVVSEIHDAVDPKRAARLSERLASASAALDRERFDEARRMVAPLVRELPRVAAVHEVAGLAAYRTGRWKQAAESLELARQLRPDPSLLPVLADCYRGLKRWDDVDSIWNDVKQASPPHDTMSEARIVAASALADRGELKDAIALMQQGERPPKKVRAHHLRQWYVLADLYDRAGDTVSAARWFNEIKANDPAFADVRDRLRALGR